MASATGVVTSCQDQLCTPKPPCKPGMRHTGPEVMSWPIQARFSLSEVHPDAGLLLEWQLQELSDYSFGQVVPHQHLAPAHVQINQKHKVTKSNNNNNEMPPLNTLSQKQVASKTASLR